jgi:hypothetical protein
MRYLLLSCFLLLAPMMAIAQMVRSDSIGNDPEKEQLCAARAKKALSGSVVPFEIDAGYVTRVRKVHLDVTFIVIDGLGAQLVECYLREGTGRYEPASFSPEQSYWRLIKPKQFEPGINTNEGRAKAARVCLETAPPKLNRANFDHSVYSGVVEIDLSSSLYRPGMAVGSTKAQRYDIAVEGTLFFRSSGPDMTAVKFTCLLSPMLEVKAVQFK